MGYVLVLLVIGVPVLLLGWKRSPWRRKKFLGMDAPELFNRLQLRDQLSFEPLHASAAGEIAGHLYRVDVRHAQGAKLPYAYAISLSFQIPHLLPPSVSIFREERSGGPKLRESINTPGGQQDPPPDHVMLSMPRADYPVELASIMEFAFGEVGERFIMRVDIQGLTLESLRVDERAITFDVSVDVTTQSSYDLKHDEPRRAFLANALGRVTEIVGEFHATHRQPLELYCAAFSAIPVEHEDWAGLADYLFVQHVDSLETQATWEELIAQRNPERMYRLIMQFPERMYESLNHNDLIDVLELLISQSLDSHILKLAEHLAPSLEPFILHAITLPLSFRMRVLELWFELKTHRAEELAPAIELMREAMSTLERRKLAAMAADSSLRGGLSSADSTPRGALTASAQED